MGLWDPEAARRRYCSNPNPGGRSLGRSLLQYGFENPKQVFSPVLDGR